MASGRYDINIYQGDSFSLPLIVKNSDGTRFNLSGYTGFGGVKSSYCSTGYLGLFTVNITNRGEGEVNVSLPFSGTALMPPTIGIYDIEFASGTFVQKYLKGYAYIHPQISNTFP